VRLSYQGGDPQDAIDGALAPVLRTMVERPGQADALAAWAVRTMPRLPAAAKQSKALWALAMAGSARVRVRPLLPGKPPSDAIRLLPGLLPASIPEVDVVVRRVGDTVELYLPPREAGAAPVIPGPYAVLAAPDTSPVILEVSDAGLAPEAVVLEPGKRKHVNVISDRIQLRTLRGDTFALIRRPVEQPRPQAAAGPRRKNVEDVPKGEPVRIYVSVAREDERFADELERHLTPLIRGDRIKLWRRSMTLAGESYEEHMSRQLARADIVLVLVSSDHLAGDDTYREMETAFRRRDQGVIVVPVIIRPAAWEQSLLGRLQPLPRGGEPLAYHKNRDRAYTEIASEIRKLAEQIERQRASRVEEPLQQQMDDPGTEESVSAPESVSPPARSILDAVPFPWADPNAQRLHDVLVNAYDDTGQIRHLAQTAGIRLSRWRAGGSASSAWQSLLDIAAAQAKLRTLVERVLRDKHVAAYHDAVRACIEPASSAE